MQIYKDIFLSVGEKQKLLIDILPENADVYLLDEPMIGLDREIIIKVVARLKRLIDENKTIIITEPEGCQNGRS